MLLDLHLGIISLISVRANIIIPTIQGRPINIVTNNENDTLLFAVCISPFVFAEAIAGTSAVANAILKDSGSETNVSTFPLKIPYCFKASPSVKKLCRPLFTVIESMFLFIDVNIELKDIGIETINMFFTVPKILFVGKFTDDTISFPKSILLTL